jgi:hypothetical protein
MPDGKSVIFKAYYTDANNSLLLRPRTEIENYCKAVGGSLEVTYQDRHNFVASAFRNPQTAFVEAMQRSYTGSVTYNVGFASITQNLNDLKPVIAQVEADQVAYTNSALDRQGAETGYMDAANRGAFGVFACVSQDDMPLWRATVAPFSYYRNTKNKLIAHQLKIIMVPEKA